MSDFQIAKSLEDQQLVFGWANVSALPDGNIVTDLQGDRISPEELEKAAYDYVLKFRDAGERHDPGKRYKGKLVESVVFTPEKMAALGIPAGTLPIGWWVGFKINDKEAWEKIKSGEYAMFSIEGSGKRELIEKAAKRNYDQFPEYHMWLEENLDATKEEQEEAKAYYDKQKKRIAKTFDEVIEELKKFNPYHDAKGRFSDRPGMSIFSPGKDPAKAATYIARENAKRKAANEGTELVQGVVMNGEISGGFRYGDGLSHAQAQARAKQKPEKKEEEGLKQTAAPKKAGKLIKWDQMSTDEFVNSLEDYMPGVGDLIQNQKGYIQKYLAQNPNANPRRINTGDWVDNKQNGDMVLTDIYTLRGYHAKPQLMTRNEIKQYIQQNGTPELYRGMGRSSSGQSGSEKQDRFAQDDLHFAGSAKWGSGVLGNGTYMSETPAGQRRNTGLYTARQYSGRAKDGTIRATYEPSMKTVSYGRLAANRRDFDYKVWEAQNAGKLDNDFASLLRSVVQDVGRFGALRGYEAILDKTGAHSGAKKWNPFHNVLNRGKIIIQSDKRYT